MFMKNYPYNFLLNVFLPSTRVDVLLGHGTGCYPVVCLCAKHDLFKSAALISPAGHLPCPSVLFLFLYVPFLFTCTIHTYKIYPYSAYL